MNYLVHAWLARQSDAAILGALLGDFVHGPSALTDWPLPIRAEIVRHWQIDRYTDSHPAVVAARAIFDPAGLRRRLAATERPEFPLQGRDVLALGVPPGPRVGSLLQEMRSWWLAGGCAADRAACLTEVARRI